MSAFQRNQSLEGLRGVASLNVLLGHFLFAFFPFVAHNVRPYPSPVARYAFERVMMYPPFTFLYLADAAVSVFFVLSGYVLTARFYATGQPDELGAAAIRRYIRLVGPAFVSVMFAWVLLECGAYGNQMAPQLGTAGWVMALYSEAFTFQAAVFQGLLGAPLFGVVGLNGPLWTLQVELLGSILLFACYALFGSRSKWALCFWFLFFAMILSSRSATMLHYVALLAGSLLHLVERQLRASRLLTVGCVAIGLAGVSFNFSPAFAFLQIVPLPDFSPYAPNFSVDQRLFWNTLGAISLVAGILGSGVLQRALSHRIPAYLGRISFPLYLLHVPVIMSLGYWTAVWGQQRGMSYGGYAALAFAVSMAAIVLLAELFSRYVDMPSIRLARAVSDRTLRLPPSLSGAPEPVLPDAGRRDVHVSRPDGKAQAHANNFDLLRLIGAILVVYTHAYALTGTIGPGLGGSSVGTFALKIFFTISGYLVAQSWLRDPNLWRYLYRRALRVLPGLTAVTLVSAFVIGPLATRLPAGEYFRHPGTWRYLENIGLYINYFLPGVFETNTYPNAVNGSIWSLPVEGAAYLLTPILLALSGPRLRGPLALVLAVGVAAFAVWRTQIAPLDHQVVFYAVDVSAALTLMPFYAIGLAAAQFDVARILNIYVAFLGLLVIAVFAGSQAVCEVLVICALPYATLAFGTGPSLRLLPADLDLSYGIFLYSFPVQQVIVLAYHGAIGPWRMFLLSLMASALLATLSWTLVERPFLSLKPRRGQAPNFKSAPAPA
jgi:peptidoglycan/LPS O-acetylase OafA/YrhL